MKPIRTLLIAALLVPALPAQARRAGVAVARPRADAGAHVRAHRRRVGHVRRRACGRSTTCSPGATPAANEAVAGLHEGRAGRRSAASIAPPSPPSAATWSAWRARTCSARTGQALFPDRSLQARKDLTAMGLTYHDSKQFLDAVKRNDTLAAELFIAGRGVDLSATDFWGRDAVDFARAQRQRAPRRADR